MILPAIVIALYAVGLGCGLYFVVTWTRRVSHPMSSAALDASGWVYVMVALLCFGLAVVFTRGLPDEALRQSNQLFFLLAFDALLVNRCRRWRRHLRRTEPPPSELHLVVEPEDLEDRR